MADYDIGAFMIRLLEMEKEAVADIKKVDGVTYFPYEQEAFPYWTNQVAGLTPGYLAQDIVQYPLRITGMLVLGHYTEGYKGEQLVKAYAYMAAVMSYFKDRPGMQSDAHPDSMDDIFTDFEIVDVVGPAAFQNSGIGVIQVGLKFFFGLPIIDIQYR